MKQRFWIILAVLILAVIIGISYVGSQQPPPKTSTNGQVTVTINKAIGIDYITINNLDADTGTFPVPFIQLPYSFNCSVSDTLEIGAKTQPNYMWTGWRFHTGYFMTDNPKQITSDDPQYQLKNRIVITPNCMRINPTPTPSPTPTPTPTPTPQL